MNSHPRPKDRTLATSSARVALPSYSSSLPTSGEKMNSRSSCGALTLPSFGAVLAALRKCHPSISRAFGTKCQGGVNLDRSSVSLPLTLTRRNQPSGVGTSRRIQPAGVDLLNALPLTTSPLIRSARRPGSASHRGAPGRAWAITDVISKRMCGTTYSALLQHIASQYAA